MNKLLVIAAISFSIGGMVGGIVVHISEGPRPLNAYEQMMVDAQKRHEQRRKDIQKALRESPYFPGDMGTEMMKAK